MSDAGKVMTDTNGDLIKGVGGVVLADRLYPTRLSCAASIDEIETYHRQLVYRNSSDHGDGIWSQDWEEGAYEEGYEQYLFAWRQFTYFDAGDYDNIAVQTIQRVAFNWRYINHAGLSVPWARIAAPANVVNREELRLSSSRVGPEPSDTYYLRGYYSFTDQDPPDGSEKMWERSGKGWLEFGTITPPATLVNVDFTIPLNTSVMWLALFADPFDPDPDDYAGIESIFRLNNAYTFDSRMGKTVDIKYNLAT